MSDLLLDLINHLENKLIIEGDSIDAFRDFTPEAPDNVVVIHEYSGSPTPLHATFLHRSFQVTARSKNAVEAKNKCNQIFDEFSPLGRAKTLSNSRVCQIYPRQAPFRIKVDDSGRVTYGFNMGVTAERD